MDLNISATSNYTILQLFKSIVPLETDNTLSINNLSTWVNSFNTRQ